MSEAENDTKTDSGLSDVIQQFPSDAPQEGSAKSSEESHEHTFEREREHKLLLCVQRILRDNGFNYSEAAIRDLPDLSQEMFNPRDAVSALSNTGFVASCGELKPSEITDGHWAS